MVRGHAHHYPTAALKRDITLKPTSKNRPREREAEKAVRYGVTKARVEVANTRN